MTVRDRVQRAKQTAVFGAKFGALAVGVAVTVAGLGLLWRLLHEAEDDALLALLAESE